MLVIDNFLDSLNSKRTKEQYKDHFERFERYFPNAKKQKEPDVKRFSEIIIAYLMQMKKEGLSHSYRNSALASIKHYYTMNDVLLNWKKISKYLGEKKFDNEIRAYTHEEVGRMLDVADTKYRAIILTYCSTGMRRQALADLRVRDFEYLPKYNLYKIIVYRGEKEQHVSFTTPEAAEQIKLYIADKKPEEFFHNIIGKSISTHLRKICITAQIGKKHDLQRNEIHGQYRDSTPAVHSLRKFCITQLGRAKVDTEIAKLLTGHSIGVRAKYLNYDDEDLLQEYVKAIPFLTISQEEKYKVENEQLLAKNESIGKAVDLIDTRLQERDRQIHNLTDKLKSMEESQKNLRKEIQQEFADTLCKFYEGKDAIMPRIVGENVIMKKIIEEHTGKQFDEILKGARNFINSTAEAETKQFDKRHEEVSASISKDSKKRKK